MEAEIGGVKPNFRQAGKQLPGKLVRGFIQDPMSKTTSASIPYKFETILYKNNNPRGFGASAQRGIRGEDLTPGPGSYDAQKTKPAESTASFSKKGYGNGFVSQTTRLLYRGYVNTGPGPGAYTCVENPFTVTHVDKRKDPKEEPQKSKTPAVDLPGPGFYNPERSKTSTLPHNRAVAAVFKSNTNRYRLTSSNPVPPPGAYEIDRALSEKKPFKHYLGSSNFMLPTTKKINKEVENKMVVNELLGKSEEVEKLPPGPGHYFKADKDDEIMLFNQKIQDKNSSNFMVGNVSRFGEVLQKKVKRVEYPGPGTYIAPSAEPQEKTLVSGAVFMSETARKPFKDMRNFVGPTKYNPELLPKKSYHLNINKAWV